MITRRRFVQFTAFALAAPILAACGSAPAPTAEPAKPAAPANAPAATAPPANAAPTATSPAEAAVAKAAATVAPAAVAPANAPKITVEFLHPWTPDQGGGGRAMVALAKRYAEIKPNVTIN